MPENEQRKPHIYLGSNGEAEPFTSPGSGRNDIRIPDRNRRSHGSRLIGNIQAARTGFEAVDSERERRRIPDQEGYCLSFVSDPGFELALDSLEDARLGIELMSARTVGESFVATVFVPKGKLAQIEKKIERYLEEDSRFGKPKNQKFVESIASIRSTAVDELWTDDESELPSQDEAIWWEVWLRAGSGGDQVLTSFRMHCEQLQLRLKPQDIRFADRVVVLVFGTRVAMESSVELLDCLAELRRAKENPRDFLSLPSAEQAEWARDLAARAGRPTRDAPAVCLLDTGVNKPHPLLDQALDDDDILTVDPSWGSHDHHPQGHGTAMAGVSLYGADMANMLSTTVNVELRHRLESVKLISPTENTEPELYGSLTEEALARAEINTPDRHRVVCLTATAPDWRDRGRPSSWSAAVDRLAFGTDSGERQLIVLAGGNVPLDRRHNYPACCYAEGIHDPGQAWNALTAGAITNRIDLDPSIYPGWRVVAPSGDLSPSSSTSLAWPDPTSWPLKPDVVFEGGNAAIDPGTNRADTPEELCLLSTHHRTIERLLSATGDTSAAAAQCARLGGILRAEYPERWPETIRGLIVHSADWTPRMLDQAPPNSASNRRKLLRSYGFGIPSTRRARWSAANHLTLIAEGSLEPFGLNGYDIKTKEMNLHPLPWPKEVLLSLGDTQVELRVTLSYFIEPNPARRGWGTRHAYASHGLRFDLRRPAESRDEFRKRMNKAAREENEDRSVWSSAADEGWQIGKRDRHRGSIHSDRWNGTAADLANRGVVGVYPVSGWWKTRKKLERWDQAVRYSLIVSIKTPNEEMDIYTPVETLVTVPVSIA